MSLFSLRFRPTVIVQSVRAILNLQDLVTKSRIISTSVMVSL